MSELPKVIVRAWGDEPVILHLHRVENDRCYVGKPDAYRPIGLPPEQVYAFRQQLFDELSAAYQDGRTDELRCLYEHIPVEELAVDALKAQKTPH